MSDLDRLTGLIDGKRREIDDFVLATAGDVMSASMSEIDRGAVALGLLGLVAKARPAPVTIEHAPTPRAIEKPRVQPYFARRAAEILETGILPAAREPVTEMRVPPMMPVEEAAATVAPAPVVEATPETTVAARMAKMRAARTPKFTDEVIGAALRAVGGKAAVAAKNLGCSMTTITKYRLRKGLATSRRPACKPGELKKHHRYEQAPAMKARKESRERKCMTCTKPFMSEGHHNRMCTGCRQLSEGIAA